MLINPQMCIYGNSETTLPQHDESWTCAPISVKFMLTSTSCRSGQDLCDEAAYIQPELFGEKLVNEKKKKYKSSLRKFSVLVNIKLYLLPPLLLIVQAYWALCTVHPADNETAEYHQKDL